MVQVPLKGVRQLVRLERGLIVVVADLHRAVSRQQLRPGIGLKAQDSLQQEGVPDLAHALHRSAVSAALQTGHFDLQAQQLYASRAVLDPLLARQHVPVDAIDQVPGDAAQFVLVNPLNKVVEPLGGLVSLRLNQRLAVQRHRYGAVAVLDLEDIALFIDIRRVTGLIGGLNHNIGVFGLNRSLRRRLADVRHEPRRHRHVIVP